ncbi:beta-2 adrenergic receptor-like [Xenia sp. Carnegie-2017]|uniref:beta-2 adrenergic receptor-like n=1 Tax=Xenia sp. Carnegie-2017 TaxID=2897299 RepID=UPI001F041E36|nr:beta-2 adrenergic receptor-like [Xenia sp. Carnegie-2017]
MQITSGHNNSLLNNSTRDGVHVDEVMHFIVLAILIATINLFVIILVCINKRLHKWPNYLLVSLACSDFITGVICIPLALLCTFLNSSSSRCTFCSLSFTCTKFTSISTVLHLLLVTYERYLFIIHPYHHEKLNAKKCQKKFALVLTWTVSLVVSLIALKWMDVRNCSEEEDNHDFMAYNVATLFLFYLIPICLFVYPFTSLFYVARMQIRRGEKMVLANGTDAVKSARNIIRTSRRKEARVAIILLLMWLSFVITWGLYFFILIFKESTIPDKLVRAANVLRVLASLLNPLLYSFLKKDFSEAIKRSCYCHRHSRYNTDFPA